MLPDKDGKKLSGKQIVAFIDKVCKKDSVINSDEFKSYRIFDNKENKNKYIHVTVNHSKEQYYKEDEIHINGIFGVSLKE